jgi:pimeloyl-ACP methyl ester carboxylesterase
MIRPYLVHVPDADLADLADRLRRTRWPEAETVDDASQGVQLGYLRELCQYWATDYDWRRYETRLNTLPQVMVDVGNPADGPDGSLEVHVVHVRSPHPGALPLLMTHGWPGSIVEFSDVVGPLTDPTAHGGSAADAFHLVLPTLPGYGFSGKPARPGWDVARIAGAWARLMPMLGYDTYGVQGGDWGSMVSAELASRHPAAVTGLHLTMPVVDLKTAAAAITEAGGQLDEHEVEAFTAGRNHSRTGRGYSTQQATRPQTVGYSLVDSPVGLCAWIVEKFAEWTDCGGDPETVFTKDQLLDNVMTYWLPAAGASAARLYWENVRKPGTGPVTVPTGCSIYPRELLRPSRRLAEHRFTDIRYWNEPTRGGHFAAFEQPASFVDEIRAFYGLLR